MLSSVADNNTQQPKSLPMTILAIETSVATASVVLWMDGAMVYHSDFTSDRNHNSMIFQPLAEALDTLGGRKLSQVLVGTGPGSYSGARTGIAAGQGVALTHGCPAVGIGSLAATSAARKAGGEKAAIAIGDARRGLYYISEMTNSGEAGGPQLMEATEFQACLSEKCEARETVLFTLDDPSGPWLAEVQLPVQVEKAVPHATGIMEVWHGLADERRMELMAQPLSPTYLRPPFTSKAKSGHPLLRSS